VGNEKARSGREFSNLAFTEMLRLELSALLTSLPYPAGTYLQKGQRSLPKV
jgi:hypothetical protein